jgi:hypothetical protein
MLTLPQIVKKASRLRHEGAQYVRITDMKKGYDSLGRGYVASASYSTHLINSDGKPVRNGDPKKYVTVITFLDNKLHVLVSCSCADFTYRWETALHSKGAADIEYSNGDSPDTTNPTQRGACCKHLIKLYERIRPKLPAPR